MILHLRLTSCVAYLFICMIACYIPISNKKFAAKQDLTIKTAESISFFHRKNEIGTVATNSGSKNKIHLFYSEDTLKYVGNEHWPYKFTKLNDSVIILSRENMFKYLAADTLLFYNDICVSKRGDYDFFNDTALIGRKLLPVHVTFSVYYIHNGDVYKDEEYLIGLNTAAELQPVFLYFEKKLYDKLVFTKDHFRGHFQMTGLRSLIFSAIMPIRNVKGHRFPGGPHGYTIT